MRAHLSVRTRQALDTARILLNSWDAELVKHSDEVAQDLVRFVPQHSPADPVEMELWRWAGQLHDLGKITIAPTVLNKPGAYTPAERRIMRQHPLRGARLLRQIGAPPLIVQAAEFHHEWWNGSGYPHRQRGERIPYIARVLAVVDAYQAMTHARAYRAAYTPAQARLEVRRLAGIQFDPAIVEVYFSSALCLHLRSRERL